MKINAANTCESLLAQQEGALRGYRVRIGNRVKLRGYSGDRNRRLCPSRQNPPRRNGAA